MEGRLTDCVRRAVGPQPELLLAGDEHAFVVHQLQIDPPEGRLFGSGGTTRLAVKEREAQSSGLQGENQSRQEQYTGRCSRDQPQNPEYSGGFRSAELAKA